MKIKNILIVIFAAILISAIFTIIFGSGVLKSTWGILYFIGIIILCGIAFFYLRKMYLDYSEEKRIKEVISDPEKLYKKLTEDPDGSKRTYIDEGKRIDIKLNEDPETGKKSLAIKPGDKITQEWRSKFERTPIEKPESKDKSATNIPNSKDKKPRKASHKKV